MSKFIAMCLVPQSTEAMKPLRSVILRYLVSLWKTIGQQSNIAVSWNEPSKLRSTR